MPRGFHRSGLMAVDMAGLRSDHPLMRAECRRNYRHVGLSSSDQEMHGKAVIPTGLPNQLCSVGTVLILTVAHSLIQIGFYQFLQHSGMSAFIIVTLKQYHLSLILSYFFKISRI